MNIKVYYNISVIVNIFLEFIRFVTGLARLVAMRINAGRYKGKALGFPKSIRPTQDKVRKAVFDVLGDIEGLGVCDLYAGSGAFGIEALSRGARFAEFVDSNNDSIKVVLGNIEKINAKSETRIIKSKVENYLKKEKNLFDFIFADPPYKYEVKNILELIGRLMKPKSVLVLEQSAKTELPEIIDSLFLIKNKKYGDTQIAFYRLKKK